MQTELSKSWKLFHCFDVVKLRQKLLKRNGIYKESSRTQIYHRMRLNGTCQSQVSCLPCYHGLRFFLSFYCIIPRVLPFVLMFVDSWIQEGCCSSKRSHLHSRQEGGWKGGTGSTYFILSEKQPSPLKSQQTPYISLTKAVTWSLLAAKETGKVGVYPGILEISSKLEFHLQERGNGHWVSNGQCLLQVLRLLSSVRVQ